MYGLRTVGGTAAVELLIISVKCGVGAEAVVSANLSRIGGVHQCLLHQLQFLYHNILLGGDIHMLDKTAVQVAGSDEQSVADLLYRQGLQNVISDKNNGVGDHRIGIGGYRTGRCQRFQVNIDQKLVNNGANHFLKWLAVETRKVKANLLIQACNNAIVGNKKTEVDE